MVAHKLMVSIDSFKRDGVCLSREFRVLSEGVPDAGEYCGEICSARMNMAAILSQMGWDYI